MNLSMPVATAVADTRSPFTIYHVRGYRDANGVYLLDGLPTLAAHGDRAIILDMSQVTFLDASGVVTLTAIGREVLGRLYVVNLCSFVDRLLRIMHLDAYLHIRDTISAAIAEIVNG